VPVGTPARPAFHFWRADLPPAPEEQDGATTGTGAQPGSPGGRARVAGPSRS
jgi:hypothetical protein